MSIHDEFIVKSHENKFVEINSKLTLQNDKIESVTKNTIMNNENIKHLIDKIEDQSEQINAIVDLGTSVKIMSDKIVDLIGIVTNLHERVYDLEVKPGKNALLKIKEYKSHLIAFFIGVCLTVVGYLLR